MTGAGDRRDARPVDSRPPRVPDHDRRSALRVAGAWLGGAGIALAMIAALLLSWRQGMKVDELVHFEQVRRFFGGDFGLEPRLSNIPGYHLLMAGLARLHGTVSPPVVRSLNAAFAGLLIVVFALDLRAIHGRVPLARVAQFAFLPILFPFFFLVYTEALSTLLVLLALLATLRQRPFVAVLMCGLATLVRQPNIVWLLLLPLISHMELHRRWPGIGDLRALAAKFWPAAPVIVAFAVFVVANRGVALGDVHAHPTDFVPRAGNPFFLLMLYPVVFAPLVLGRMRRSVRWVGRHRLAVPGLGAAFILYLLAFENTHPYNSVHGEYYLHNRLLIALGGSAVWKAVFFIPVAVAIADLIAAADFRAQRGAILLVAALYLAPSWLIDPRYCVVPFALLMLFRRDEAPWLENVDALYAIGMSAFLLEGIRAGRFFL
jgi:alpha-1,2-glucosyltransferase